MNRWIVTGAVFVLATLWVAPAQAGQFGLSCSYTHSLRDDPIVAPNLLGGAHLHDFIGNTSTNAFSTRASLRASSTTCLKGADADKSAYWFPAVLSRQADGSFRPYEPESAIVYYQGDRNTEPFAPGMRFIAGDARATSPQSTKIVSWTCINGEILDPHRPWCVALPGVAYPPNLRLIMRFPSCWDGNVDRSGNYTAHMTYRISNDVGFEGACPRGYPRRVPEIFLFLSYRGPGGPDAEQVSTAGAVKLASGGQLSAHGDFFEAWNTPVLTDLIARCIVPVTQPAVGCG